MNVRVAVLCALCPNTLPNGKQYLQLNAIIKFYRKIPCVCFFFNLNFFIIQFSISPTQCGSLRAWHRTAAALQDTVRRRGGTRLPFHTHLTSSFLFIPSPSLFRPLLLLALTPPFFPASPLFTIHFFPPHLPVLPPPSHFLPPTLLLSCPSSSCLNFSHLLVLLQDLLGCTWSSSFVCSFSALCFLHRWCLLDIDGQQPVPATELMLLPPDLCWAEVTKEK